LPAQGKFLLVFPKDPDLPIDSRYQMTPFQKGFTRLGKPIRYNPINNPAKERARLKNLLEHTIHNMILQTSHGEIVQLPLLN